MREELHGRIHACLTVLEFFHPSKPLCIKRKLYHPRVDKFQFEGTNEVRLQHVSQSIVSEALIEGIRDFGWKDIRRINIIF